MTAKAATAVPMGILAGNVQPATTPAIGVMPRSTMPDSTTARAATAVPTVTLTANVQPATIPAIGVMPRLHMKV